MITVTTQAELDEEIAAGEKPILIGGTSSPQLHVSSDVPVVAGGHADICTSGRAVIVAVEDAHVEAAGHEDVKAQDYTDVTAGGHVSVRASDYSTITAGDHASVHASGFVTVHARGHASVHAAGVVTVHAWGSATVRAGSHVTVYVHSRDVEVSGAGHVIDVTDLDLTDPLQWAEFVGADVDADGRVHLFKALDDEMTAGHGYVPTVYAVGSDVEPDRWIDNDECGGGLHACPTVTQAIAHFRRATRYVEVAAPIDQIRPIDPDKAKAPLLHVVREVDRQGRPLPAVPASADSEVSGS